MEGRVMDFNLIKQQAEKELHEELFRVAVNKYKEKLRRKKWWHVILPFKIIIIRRS